MGYVVNKETMQPMTFEEAQAHSNANPHSIDGVEFVLTLSFTDEGLQGTRYALLDTGDMPLLDPAYYKQELSAVTESGGKYSAAWVPSPSDLPIEEIAEKKLDEIRAECGAAIESGFYSSALGDQHFYSSDRDSQTNTQWNLFAAMVGESVNHICYDSDGVRAAREHTAAQMIQVSRDFGGHIWPKLNRFNDKRSEINAAVDANDKAALIAISWT